MNLYKNCTAKAFLFSVIDSTLVSDNPLSLIKKLLDRIFIYLFIFSLFNVDSSF